MVIVESLPTNLSGFVFNLSRYNILLTLSRRKRSRIKFSSPMEAHGKHPVNKIAPLAKNLTTEIITLTK